MIYSPYLNLSLMNTPCSTLTKLILFFALPGMLYVTSCMSKKNEPAYLKYIDTTITVYGSYAAVKLPIAKGVKISNPIQLAAGPGDVMYAANGSGEVYTLRDTDNDGLEDEALLYCNVNDAGLRLPGGFAFRGDTIYIGASQQIRAYLDTDKDGDADTSWMFFDKIPYSEHPYEWTSGLTFGADGSLYVALATDSWNAAPSPDPLGYRGAILRISPNGKHADVLATGIRSVYGMQFHPDGALFFIDNEGGGNPTEELNMLVPNSFYGHNKKKYQVDSITPPVFSLTTEVAPSELVFNTTTNDFGGTAGNLFVSFYGPGERWNRGGVGRVEMVKQPDNTYRYQEFPVAEVPKLSNLAFGKDGSLYLAQHGKSDYWYNVIYENEGCFYKLIYDSTIQATPIAARRALTKTLSENAIEAGKQLFAERACLGCHSVDGETELLGPNLRDVTRRLSREDILEEIVQPSARIKPSMQSIRIMKTNGQSLIGRVVTSTDSELSLMLVGNQVVQVKRTEIATMENEKKSLMYENLLKGLDENEIQYLLDYLSSLTN